MTKKEKELEEEYFILQAKWDVEKPEEWPLDEGIDYCGGITYLLANGTWKCSRCGREG